jgi:hypothetical protein
LDGTAIIQKPTWNRGGRMNLDGTTNDIQPIVVVHTEPWARRGRQFSLLFFKTTAQIWG